MEVAAAGTAMLMLASFLQSRGLGRSNNGKRIQDRRDVVNTICTSIQSQIKPDRLPLLDVGLSNFTRQGGNAYNALEEGLKMVHATTKETLPGGLLPMSFNVADSKAPERAVAELWCSSGIRRAVEHTIDNHTSAWHVNGMHVVIFGPGARDWLHAKMIAMVGISSQGSSVGCDYVTTMPLPCEDPLQPWNFGDDTMVIRVASPKDKVNPYGASIIHDRLLEGDRAASALAACNAVYDAQPMGCSYNNGTPKCNFRKEGCFNCRRRGIDARLSDIATPRYEHGTHPLVGVRFQKRFDDGEWYEGKITSWKRGRYKLEYDDSKEKRFAGRPVRDAEEKYDDMGQITKQKRFKILK
jgi:hypothetical protein